MNRLGPCSTATRVAAESAETAGATEMDPPQDSEIEGREVPSEELAARSGAGEAGAFEALVLRHTDRVFGLLLRWVGNRQDAEDLTQETFLRAYRSIRRYSPHRPFLPWLFSIARRAAVSHWRKAGSREALQTRAEWWTDGGDPAACLERDDRSTALWRLARRLKPKQYQALWLRYGEGLEIPEVARVLGTNSIHVKVLLYRGRTALARMLEETEAGREVRPAMGWGHQVP